MDNIYNEIREAVTQRSKDINSGAHRSVIDLWNIHLMKLWEKLPDQTPEPLSKIELHGRKFFLQSVDGATYRYVPTEVYNVDNFAYAPIPRRTKILMELHTLKTAIAETNELKAQGINELQEEAEPDFA